MTSLITLTTDFGTRDAYAAAMKGVMAARCPEARILDLTHDIAPHDIREAAFFLAGACPWFPPGTIHVVVVDPGVGTARRALAAHIGGQRFVCPDNGVLTLLARGGATFEAHAIANPVFRLDAASATFHGRDIFAPAAAALASGRRLDEAGPRVDDPVLLPFPEPRWENGVLHGEVVHVDRFGNVVTNIPRAMLAEGGKATAIHAGRRCFDALCETYADVEPGEALALVGSADLLELGVNQGSAAHILELELGTAVQVVF